jgi:hypothetical protein
VRAHVHALEVPVRVAPLAIVFVVVSTSACSASQQGVPATAEVDAGSGADSTTPVDASSDSLGDVGDATTADAPESGDATAGDADSEVGSSSG